MLQKINFCIKIYKKEKKNNNKGSTSRMRLIKRSSGKLLNHFYLKFKFKFFR